MFENKCIFCAIANKHISSDIVYEDERFIAFSDMAPQAPVHIVLIPKRHYDKFEDMTDKEDMAGFLSAISRVVIRNQLEKNGYRIVVNSGHDAGQTVAHLHAHILAGRQLHWPPG